MGNTVGRQLCISQIQRDIIIGSLFGDARLECRSKNGTSRLRIHHGWKQKELVFWKYRKLKQIVSTPPRKIVCWQNPKTGEDYFSWYFHSLTLKELGELHKIFYGGKRKILPKNIESLLGKRALAVWIMDDGCNTGDSLILNTQNFSLAENREIRAVLRNKFGLESHLNKDRDTWRLRFPKHSFLKVCHLIQDYVIPSMRYKLSP